jgi:hypothetical protein
MQSSIITPILQWASQHVAKAHNGPLKDDSSEDISSHGWSWKRSMGPDAYSISEAAAALQRLLEAHLTLQQEEQQQKQTMQERLKRMEDEHDKEMAAKVSTAMCKSSVSASGQQKACNRA